MPNLGYRSVEVMLTNQTMGDLSVQGVSLGSGCSWIQGEGAKQGDVLAQYNSVTWGVLTNDLDGTAYGRINLHGLGQQPVIIEFSNDSAGNKICNIQGNTTVSAGAVTWRPGEDNHVQGSADLSEASGTQAKTA